MDHSRITDMMSTFAEIDDHFVRVLHGEEYHRYLGRYLSISESQRLSIEFRHRK